MGATREQIARVQAIGYAGWLDEQFAMAPSGTRWDWMVSKGLDALANKNSEAGADPAIWRKMLSSPDTLRQRVTLALSEILVASVSPASTAAGRRFRRPPTSTCSKARRSATTAPCCSKCRPARRWANT